MAVSPGKIHPKAKQKCLFVFGMDYAHPEGEECWGFVGLGILIVCFGASSLARENPDHHQ